MILFSISGHDGSLDVVYMCENDNPQTTRGLLGTLDGKKENEFTLPNGTAISINSSLQEIHYNFGMSWLVLPDESFFTYPEGKNSSDYSDPEFEPLFEILAELIPADANSVCGNSLACLYDYIATRDRNFANHTRFMEEDFQNRVQIMSQEVPLCEEIDDPENGFVNSSDGFYEGSIITFQCFENFQLTGESSLTCRNRIWSGNPPICEFRIPKFTLELPFHFFLILVSILLLAIIILIIIIGGTLGLIIRKKLKKIGKTEPTKV